MKEGYTFIAVVLDRSGSMELVKNDTMGGFNTFLTHQQHIPGRAELTMTQFNTEIETVYEPQPIAECPKLTNENFVPAGGTALLDAIGITITKIGAHLAIKPESERPSRVVFVIVTDGEENSSREYTRSKVFNMIKHQTEKYGWDFVFLGANQDAIREAASMGISAAKAMNFAANAKGTRSAFASTSAYVGRARLATDDAAFTANSFTAEDRQEQVDASQKNATP